MTRLSESQEGGSGAVRPKCLNERVSGETHWVVEDDYFTEAVFKQDSDEKPRK